MHTTFDLTQNLYPFLTIVLLIVHLSYDEAQKNLDCHLKVNAMFKQIGMAFSLIPFEYHLILNVFARIKLRVHAICLQLAD